MGAVGRFGGTSVSDTVIPTVTERAVDRKRVAESILADLDLVHKWERFGRPVLVGAFAYDLLVAPEPMLASLTPETRTALLELKEARGRDKSLSCPSIDLYRPVLDNQVRTPDELRTWLGSHKTGDLSDWRPKGKAQPPAALGADKPCA